MTYKINLIIVMLVVLISNGAQAADLDKIYGADANPTGDPIGGGAGYRAIIEKGDFSVTTADELLSALKKAKSGQTVYVAADANIDLTDRIPKLGMRIENGVTLAGNRGKGGAKGPLLFTTKMPDRMQALFMARGNSRITGLRIRGESYYSTRPEGDLFRQPGAKEEFDRHRSGITG